MSSQPRSRSLRLHRNYRDAAAFLITKKVQPRKPVLLLPERRLIMNSLRYSVEADWIRVAAFVAMPDHWHAVMGLTGQLSLDGWMHRLMSFVGSRAAECLKNRNCFWQDGFHDVEVRSRRQFLYLINYVEWNPVRAGLVGSPEEWETSSCSRPAWVVPPWV